ncbi:ParM/StbA family protein [Pelomicrobium methylotrophicum]|uniref:ParM/StbA family protein n=1 Tax=Pelomicrobium methylotrophicum TaxID=2602750 RepID=A0A5C7EII2_9PROT|nr:ParM/StbA family protein [Pelomicrobium methylotrophicum]TXF11183.1 ParM/StbA family protein [Pelomicrobium methylotrophicum]
MNILGIDIGYSNLKLAFGPKGESPKTHLRPAGAAPADRFGFRFDGKAREDRLHVLVDGEEFIAGVSPDRAEMWSRSLHADYPSSASYKALFHAGLLLSEMDRIDMLVTGLPVSQYLDEARRTAVAGQMQGTHQVTPKRAVTVERVKVIPQPIGGLLDYIAQENADIEDARVLVVDPGFFSVDWVVVAHQDIHRQSSGTSLNASSVVLEEASRLIASDHGSAVNTETLENAIRSGKPTVLVLGQRVEIAPYIGQAAKTVGPVVVESIQKSLRTEGAAPDVVVLVGGGADFFREAVQAAFPRLNVVTPKDPVYSNARGFWLMGASL